MDIKILVCYHKLGRLIGNKFVLPILVGTKNISHNILSAFCNKAKQRQVSYFRDDIGDNISHLNPNYCELTAIYWAWKNLKADYCGLFHYRRILNFAPPPHILNNIPLLKFILSNRYIKPKYLVKACQEADIILPTPISEKFTIYENYASYHYKNDMDLCIQYIQQKYPYMQDILKKTLHTPQFSWHTCNIFVMRKDLFNEYCEWLFDILFAIAPRIPTHSYDKYQVRVFGFLSERLLNVWVEYKKESTPHLKIKEYPVIFLEFKSPIHYLVHFSAQQKGKKTIKRLFICGIRVWKSIKEANEN